jgi:hypothetical protein
VRPWAMLAAPLSRIMVLSRIIVSMLAIRAPKYQRLGRISFRPAQSGFGRDAGLVSRGLPAPPR